MVRSRTGARVGRVVARGASHAAARRYIARPELFARHSRRRVAGGAPRPVVRSHQLVDITVLLFAARLLGRDDDSAHLRLLVANFARRWNRAQCAARLYEPSREADGPSAAPRASRHVAHAPE